MRNKQQGGFTLIELLVVIVILGILSTISVGTFRGYFAKARDAERLSTVMALSKMIKMDSGGRGNCEVYNYLESTGDGSIYTGKTYCRTPGKLEDLLASNDYSMPTVKNGLEYYYGLRSQVTTKDNDFFVFVVAEQDAPQSGKVTKDGITYVYIDGTSFGIERATTQCIPLPSGTGCGFAIKKIRSDGSLY